MKQAEKLIKHIKSANYCIVFTGAGVSTLSGIRDFRGANGLYKDKNIDADKLFDLEYFYKDPGYFYAKAKEFIYGLDSIKPNIVHKTLVAWEKRGIVKSVITQNIDLLHQKAGSKNVLELHGSPRLHTCLVCGKIYSYREIVAKLNRMALPAMCSECNGIIKPNITFFGEMLDDQVCKRAAKEVEAADLMLVLGSSLSVFPAANFPLRMIDRKQSIIIINNQQPPFPFQEKALMYFDDLLEVFEELNKNEKLQP